MPYLLITRHGATKWAEENRFAGWGDTPLSNAGQQEAISASNLLSRSKVKFDVIYCSRLLRARQTLDLFQGNCTNLTREVRFDWRLNERHYGRLQGRTREEVIAEYGRDMTLRWRRSFDEIPPLLQDGDYHWSDQLQRFSDIPLELQPRSESIKAAALRVSGVWKNHISVDLANAKNVLVIAHTSSIRGLTRQIENLDDKATENFRIPTAVPVCYEFSGDLQTFKRTVLQSGLRSRLRSMISKIKPRNSARL